MIHWFLERRYKAAVYDPVKAQEDEARPPEDSGNGEWIFLLTPFRMKRAGK